MWVLGALFTTVTLGAVPAAGQTSAPVLDAGWREPLDRAQVAMSRGEIRRAELAWEEAQRAAMQPTIPPTGLVNVGLAYLKIGEAAHDRQTAVTRTRQVLLRALFRARHQRDVEGLTAVSHAFARLGDCEVAGRAFAVVLTMSPKQPPPACGHRDAFHQPSASPGSDTTTGARPTGAR